MKLRAKTPHLGVLEERPAPKRPLARFMTLIYVLALFGVLAYVGVFLVDSFLTVEGRGTVELDKQYVGAGAQGVVVQLFAAERQRVEQDQPLAKLDLNVKETIVTPPTTPLERERLRKEREVNILASRLGLLKTRLRTKQRQLAKMRDTEARERALEIRRIGDPAESARLVREVEDLRFKLEELQVELVHERDYLRNLGETDVPVETPPVERFVTLTSPAKGTITTVYKGLREFLSERDVLMAVVPDDAQMRIRAYFPLADLPHLKPGRTAKLVFPDGTELTGTIGEAYAVNHVTGSTLLTDMLAKEGSVAEVEIVPVVERSDGFWQQFNNMEIQVRVLHEWLGFLD